MRLVVVVGVLIWTSLLVGVGSTSIGAERVKWDWKTWTQECLKECDDLPQGQKGPCFSDCVRRHIGIARQDFPEFQDQDFNDTLDMADSPGTASIAGISRKDQDFNDTLDMADSPELPLAASSYPKYKGFAVGCYKSFCFRHKWKDSSRWGWIEDWHFWGRWKNQYVPCENNQYCLAYVTLRPGDFPCYVSKWSDFPCYKGRRFGCAPTAGGRKGCCWYETLKAPYYWDWVYDTFGKPSWCSQPVGRVKGCSHSSHQEIDKLGEI